MPSKTKTNDSESPWYLHFYNAIRQTPINVTLLIVSAFIFYKVVSITRRRNQSVQHRLTPGQGSFLTAENRLPPLRSDFTVRELRAYNGTHEDGRILLAINFNVYDVSHAKHFYGPGGIYPNYAGRDISRNLINFSVESNENEEFDDLCDLNSGQMATLREWDHQYAEKYPLVGKLLREGQPHTNYADEEDDEPEKITQE
ncbi:membrane-associated progesterone receptor component 1 [Scaptodrosophila lebanonensis]|uniref:Membrane-associated progesterone receptor component 1 n=1 Tax=Drosophila lebanonensis TaxID=7225 RepID=A0A6J2TQT5_DROLE|nr:membrane-associated progesterone receptor component 1 [Scaptodrosophila lebanonensis]